MILLKIQLHIRSGKRREFVQHAETLISKTLAMEGCTHCVLYQEYGVEDRFCFLQEWNTRSNLDQYLRSDDFDLLLGGAQVLAEPPEIKLDITRGGMEIVKMVRAR